MNVRRLGIASLSLSLLLTCSAVGGDAARAEEPTHCADAADTGDTAAALARDCGEPVELLAARTPWETWYALPDGQWRMEVSARAVRAQVDGAWTAVDTSLVAGSGGIVVAAPANPMVFSDGSSGSPLARIERDGHELVFDVPFDLPAPELGDSQLIYPGVLPDVDLIVSVNDDGSGFGEVLRIATPEAATDPRLAELGFDVEVSDGLDLAEADGGFVATDAEGEAVFTSPAPVMWDSSADVGLSALLDTPMRGTASVETFERVREQATANEAARLVGPIDGDEIAPMDIELLGDEVRVIPDRGLLADPSTEWPVYVDPRIDGSRTEWVSVRNDGYSDYNYSGDQGVGHCGTTGSPMYCSKVLTRRAVWQFRGLQSVGNAEPGDVQSAVLSVYGVHSYSCTPYPVEAWWTGGISSATTWSTVSWLRLEQTQSVAHKAACGNARRIEFDVTAAGREVANYNADQLTVGLKASDESSSTGWKRYDAGAELWVTFNRTPNAPTGLQVSNPPVACGGVVNSASPTLRATASDPEGDNVYGTFVVSTSAGAQVWSGGTNWQVSGSSLAVTVPSGVLADGGAYRFTVAATDTSGRWGPSSSACAFTANTSPPGVVPTITPLAGQPAVYGENGRTGGVGVTGRFSFGANGVGDVVSFRYGFDDTATPLSVAVGGQVAYTPTSAGVHTLSVRSVDRGGLTSPRRDYQFVVDVPASAGRWLFDDSGSSITVADASGAGHPLTLSSAGIRSLGMLAELDPQAAPPNDGALSFAAPTDQAASTVPVVSTDRSYTVTAFVKLSDLSSRQTIVSQAGAHAAAFDLGYRPAGDPACVEGCWAFTVAGADSTSAPDERVVVSDLPVSAGQWTFLAATYDSVAHQVRLYATDAGGEPVPSGDVSFTAGWFSTGGFVLGHGFSAGASAYPLHGAVDVVRVLAGVADMASLRDYAAGSTAA